MDEYLFSRHLERCKFRVEKSRYLEIFNYSVGDTLAMLQGSFLQKYQNPAYRTSVEEPLAAADDFGNFLKRKVTQLKFTPDVASILWVVPVHSHSTMAQGTFAPPEPRDGATFQNGMRLV